MRWVRYSSTVEARPECHTGLVAPAKLSGLSRGGNLTQLSTHELKAKRTPSQASARARVVNLINYTSQRKHQQRCRGKYGTRGSGQKSRAKSISFHRCGATITVGVRGHTLPDDLGRRRRLAAFSEFDPCARVCACVQCDGTRKKLDPPQATQNITSHKSIGSPRAHRTGTRLIYKSRTPSICLE